MGDLECLVTRAVIGEATPRDLASLRDGLAAALQVVVHLQAVINPSFREAVELTGTPIDTISDVSNILTKALTTQPPTAMREGAVFQSDYDEQLRAFESLRNNGAEKITELEAQLRETTGISTLKVRFTRVFGWYIEVSRAHMARVPANWRRKQTIATGERFTVADLEDLADSIEHAEEQYRQRELELYQQLLALVASAAGRIQALSSKISNWDVASTLAELAHRYDYCRPTVDDNGAIEIVDGRHPVVERLAAAGRFVPNDCSLNTAAECLWLITGPNMAGKSTFLRQVALTVLLAQMGSYVPAKRAHIGIVNRIMSRVGASDNVARGDSTFMVEMRETSRILHNATRRSLVILDEIGRGTSTYDGLAIAWSVIEYLDEIIGCRAVFATHYHELTRLESSLRHVANYNVTAKEVGDDVVFLYQLVRGAASRSFGVAVAKLADLPERVILRAKAVLAELENQMMTLDHLGATRISTDQSQQLDLFHRPANADVITRIAEELKNLSVDRLTPIEALMLVDNWRKSLR